MANFSIDEMVMANRGHLRGMKGKVQNVTLLQGGGANYWVCGFYFHEQELDRVELSLEKLNKEQEDER